jgi:hypothetical protein
MGLITNKRLRSSDLRIARSDQFLADIGDIPRDFDKAYFKAQALIKDAGWRFKKRSGATAHGRKFTMTLSKTIWLSAGWDDYEVWKKASILWHELVHVRQRQAWGHSKFLSRYSTARGRWYIEVPAYRMSVRAYERLSGGKFNGTNYIQAKLTSFRKDYWLRQINYSQYFSETQKIWNQERR